MSDFYDELEYPEKAEYLSQYKNYRVDIEHWKELSDRFGKVYRGVYTRGSAAFLLVYGPKGTGKSLFCRRLKEDYEATRAGLPPGGSASSSAPAYPARDNLWHTFMAASRPTELAIDELTRHTSLELVNDRAPGASGAEWFNQLKALAAGDRSHRVRIYLWDDAHYETIMRPWAGFSTREFFEARQAGYKALLAHVAQRMNYEVRHDFARSILIMLSNDRDWVDTLKENLDKWYEELASVLQLPVPAPEALERVVRVNTNRLTAEMLESA